MIFKHTAYADNTYGSNIVMNSSQSGSSSFNVNQNMRYNFASFEVDSYDIDNPRPLFDGSPGGLALSSTAQSDEYGVYESPIVLTAEIGSATDFSGITIETDVIITDVTIEEYQGETLIRSDSYTNDSIINYFSTSSKNITKVVITVNKINKAYRFLDIFSLNFGKTFMFSEDTIKSPKMINQFSVSGRELPIDSFELTLVDVPNELLLDHGQKLEIINDDETLYTFFVNSFEPDEDVESVKITYNDCVALLETEFMGGFYENAPIKDVVDSILDGSGITCEYDKNVLDFVISGYLPVTTRRNALIYVANATGCKFLKHPTLKIFKPYNAVYANFDESNIFLGSMKKTAKKPSKEVNLTLINYASSTNEDDYKTVFEKEFETGGLYEIKFEKPLYPVDGSTVKVVDLPVGVEQSQVLSWAKPSVNGCVFRLNENYKGYPVKVVAAGFLMKTLSNVTVKKQIPNAEYFTNYEVQNIDSFTLMHKRLIYNNVTEPGYPYIIDELMDYYSKKESLSFKCLWSNPKLDGYVNVYGNKKQVTKLTTSFTEAVEIEVE